MLEEKGWILLETNDKVFVLNTLGLHDITTNHGKCYLTSTASKYFLKLKKCNKTGRIIIDRNPEFLDVR